MDKEFYAAIKLTSGEEIFSLVSPVDEDDRTLLMLENPVIMEPMISRNQGVVGYKVKPWMIIPDDDIYIINMDNVITITEIDNDQIIKIYKNFNKNTSQVSLEKDMGFISKVNDARKSLENLYNI